MNELFSLSINEINRFRTKSQNIVYVFSCLRAIVVGAMMAGIWIIVEPTRPLFGIVIGLLNALMLARFLSPRKRKPIEDRDFVFGLDLSSATNAESPYTALRHGVGIGSDWPMRLQREVKRVKALEMRRISGAASSLVIPLLMSFLLLSKASVSVSSAFSEAAGVLTFFSSHETFEIVSGAFDPTIEKKVFAAKSIKNKIKLLPNNLIRVTVHRDVSAHGEVPPSILITSTLDDKKTVSSFQLRSQFDQEGKTRVWSLDFNVEESSILKWSDASSDGFVEFEVVKLPIPEVSMVLKSENKDTWADDVPVPLSINVEATNPLRKVQLVVTARGKSSVENVSSILGESKKNIELDYNLNLEPYMSEDFVDIQIIAQAVDSASPSPLVGASAPIVIKSASAYGRYKITLSSLNSLRSLVEDSLLHPKSQISQDAVKTAKIISQQAEVSPFFDTLDRMNIAKILSNTQGVAETLPKERMAKLIDLNQELGDFLFEHETLDDRERDRDFFVAIRTFSRVLEKSRETRQVSSELVAQRILEFLDGRSNRWSQRVKRIPDQMRPKQTDVVINQKPFHKSIRDSLFSDQQGLTEPSQTQITFAASSYKLWIDQLEAAEDEARKRQQQDQQQALSDARSDLRDLQQRQDQVSTALDRASSRTQDDLSIKWLTSRPDQLSNTKMAMDLLKKVQSLSPESGSRLSAAIDAMEETVSQGNKANFVLAESASDAAGRLLRDAEKSAAKKQEKSEGRGRRKRSPADSFYGNAFVGGDVEFKTEYQVDSRYREEVLNDALENSDSTEEKQILEHYLRQILR